MFRSAIALVALVACVVAAVGCHARPSAIHHSGVILTTAPASTTSRDGGVLLASTHYARSPEPRELPPFDARAARDALGRVDVSSCSDAIPAAVKEGHARVTFAPDGTVVKLIVDAPAELPDEARACVHRALSRAAVPEFAGSAVTLGTTWRLR